MSSTSILRASAATAMPQVDASAEREAKVQELLHAGNWNVLVLHAAEWTRKQPENANAWKHLSVGYANLGQTADALAAMYRAPGPPADTLPPVDHLKQTLRPILNDEQWATLVASLADHDRPAAPTPAAQ